ncbi:MULTISPECIES: glycine zipper domain-containing protein [Cetobacterium]|jgi:chemotaxis protein MotB|uniref:Glycine zipper domain-containing protein n=1 Tax=Candidatus Cetobacterium colombiensis TaxID=3073100 RepID=A0ABU4WAS0_9FUSO|nr:glycine zipper domain-containing protein [Candidatus Cetobacterium colombiensis]MDX8336616.1 glycine zipper domain-containing protein [Candidatus Cetobacterium colombiensis]
MIKRFIFLSALVTALVGCGNGMYSTPRVREGALGGAAVGAIAGQLIGRNTAGTLIGAGIGALAGAAIGHERDENAYRRYRNRYY